MAVMQAKYPDDIFEVVTRRNNAGEYDLRIKCTDCPGKVCNMCSVLNVCKRVVLTSSCIALHSRARRDVAEL